MSRPKRIMLFAWGSRGDIQPIAVLAQRLKAEGREVLVFATPPSCAPLFDWGIDVVQAQENIADFVEAMFGQLDLSDRSIRGLFKQLKLAKAYLDSPEIKAIQKADMETALATARGFAPDAIIVPNLISGHYTCIAEALNVPLITLDLQINHPTREYPIITLEVGRFPKWLNRSLYRIRTRVYGKLVNEKYATMRAICDLPADSYADGSRLKTWPHDLPQFCAVSAGLCPQPHDWPAHKVVGGWLMPPAESDYRPSSALRDFLKQRPVCIGFGSMTGNPAFRQTLSTLAIKALKTAGLPGILLGGWAGLSRESLDLSTHEGRELYDWSQAHIYELDACPHEWLFPQCSAVVHHGGAGTLAAAVRSGRPSIVCAMVYDQPFHGSLVRARGIGTYMGLVGGKGLTAQSLADAMLTVTTNDEICVSAKELGEQVRREDSLQAAVAFIDRFSSEFPYPWPIERSRGLEPPSDKPEHVSLADFGLVRSRKPVDLRGRSSHPASIADHEPQNQQQNASPVRRNR
ncbi:MAG: glycosyltransferase [Pseudomonadota bacterium]